MTPAFAAILSPSEVLIAVGLVGAGLALTCLRILAEEMEFATRRHRLHAEAEQLRLKQQRWLTELGLKHRR
jgi:hypothetical protein